MRLLLAFVGMVVIWSTVPLALKWSLDGASYIFGATSRVVIAALCILPWVAISRTRLPRERAALKAYAFSAINFLGMYGMYWGARYIPSGWIGVTIATMPLTTALMAALWLEERSLESIKVVGLLTGFVGILVVFDTAIDLGTNALLGVIAIFISVTVASGASVGVKHAAADISGIQTAAGGLIVAAPIYLLIWAVFDPWWPTQLPLRAGLSMAYVGILGTGLVFPLLYFVLRHMPATRVSLMTMVTPVTALLLGTWLNDESVSLRVWLGTALILAALFMHEYLAPRQAVTER